MASCELREASVHAAKQRSPALGVEYFDVEGDPPWEQTKQQPLVRVFVAELTRMLVEMKEHAWKASGGFLWFRLREEDVRGALREETAMLVHTGSLEWLHDRVDDSEYYGEADTVGLEELGLHTHETLWRAEDGDAYSAYTQNIRLHPRYGSPAISDVRRRYEFHDRLFDESLPVLDPTGDRTMWVEKHRAVGDRRSCWFRVSLDFFDAIANELAAQ